MGERRLAMRAAIDQQMDAPAVAAIEREILVERLEPHRPAGDQILAAMDRMPEPAQIAAGEPVGADMSEIGIGAVGHRRWLLAATRNGATVRPPGQRVRRGRMVAALPWAMAASSASVKPHSARPATWSAAVRNG